MSKFPATSYWHPDGMRIGEGGHFVEASEYRSLLRQRDALAVACRQLLVFFNTTRPHGRVLESDPDADAILKLVCAIGHPDISGAVERVAREAFDMSWIKSRAQEAVASIESDSRRPFALLRPSMSIDGNKWCALYGENLQDGVAGFGDSPDAASRDFDRAWLEKLPTITAFDAAKEPQ